MCGIAVVVGGARDTTIAATRKMMAAQVHRGPDDEGIDVFDLPHGRTLAMGFRRLAIHDLSAAGHQPMTDARTGTTLVFNGEIYNFKELRRELEAKGTLFRSRTDTEVLLAGFVTWGHDLFTKLAGMFAVVIYEPKLNWLTIARDPLGIKPLYIGRTRDGIAVASELNALRASGIVPTEVDRSAVASFLAYGAVQRPLTVLAAAKCVRQSTYTLFDYGPRLPTETTTRFWALPRPNAGSTDDPVFRSELGRVLRNAVDDHLDADVPVGVFLSSGVDSTAILKFACESRPCRVDAFTVSIGEGTALDEAPVAARTAQVLGARFHRVQVNNKQAATDFDDWVTAMDQPTIDGLNTFIVSRAVKRAGVGVALSGLGGDELFGGYATFRDVPLFSAVSTVARVLPRFVRNAAPRIAQNSLGLPARQLKAIEAMLGPDGDVLRATLARRRLFSNVTIEALGLSTPDAFSMARDWVPRDDDALRPMLADASSAVRQAELMGYMGNMLLVDSDVFSNANSLELRVPFLDQRVLALALSHRLPSAAFQPAKSSILAQACGGLPIEVIARAKQGFALDYERFLRGRLHDMQPAIARFYNQALGVRSVSGDMGSQLDPHRRVALWLASRALGA